MKMKNYLALLLLFVVCLTSAQVGVGTVAPDGALDVFSTTDGILVPRIVLTATNVPTVVTPTISELVYNTNTSVAGPNQVTPGFYFWDGALWNKFAIGNINGDWRLDGNAGTSPATNFIGTTDNQDLIFRRFNLRAGRLGSDVTSFGLNALNPLATGIRNTAVGANTLSALTTGTLNTAIGESTLISNTTGSENTAIGVGSMFINTSGNDNTSIGRNAMTSNTIGNSNVAIGHTTLRNNTTGNFNTGIGRETLRNNTTGIENTATGNNALFINTTGNSNTASGIQALRNTNSDNNTAIGKRSLFNSTTGSSNSAVGLEAGSNITTGSNNIMIGANTVAPIVTGSDQLNIGNTIYGSVGTTKMVGINKTAPEAILDITSTTNGILIPRVALTSRIVAAPVINPQTGLVPPVNATLIYNTATTGVTPNNVVPGFYYWETATSKWIGLSSTSNGDHDWYEVGTTVSPDNIADDMFHSGRVGIGRNTTTYQLDLRTTLYDTSFRNTFANPTTNGTDKIAFYNEINNTSNDATYGIYNNLLGTSTGRQFGTNNSIGNNLNGIHIGTNNELLGTGTGRHYGVYSDLSGAGTGLQYGSTINISNSGNAIHYGTNNNLSGSGTGIHYGVYTDMSGTGTGEQYGSYNSITNTGGAIHYGTYIDLLGAGNGNQFGSNVNIGNTGTGTHYGNATILTGAGAGIQYGSSNTITNTGNGIHYGVFNSLTGTGTGFKYGSYNLINAAAGGTTHYGVYSEALKTGAGIFAGYFLGNVAIGTTTANTYRFPVSRGTVNQIMQTDGAGLASWVTPSTAFNSVAWLTTGNSGTTPATNFIGTTDAFDFVLKTGGSAATNERMRVLGAGANPGRVVINNTSAFTGDVFSAYANNTSNGVTNSITNTIGNSAINGYASGNGIGVYAETNGGAATSGSAILSEIYGTSTTASTTSEGLYAINSTNPLGTGATSAIASGVTGEANGIAGNAITIGVFGTNFGTTGTAVGVYGLSSSPNAASIIGLNTDATAGFGHGIQGQTLGFGGAAGVRGFNTATAIGAGQSGYGVRGSVAVSPSGSGFVIGIRGEATGTSGTAYGMYGGSSSATGFGINTVNMNANGTSILAIGNNTAGTFLNVGSGIASNGTSAGVFGYGRNATNGIGIIGVGNNTTILTPASGAGVAGTGTQYGVMGFATTTVNTLETTNSPGNGAAASAGGYFEVQNAGTPQTWAYVGVSDSSGTLRKIIGPGTVNTIVDDLQGNKVALSCPESPENLFQDYGQGTLVNGKVHITIDPIFAKNIVVNDKHPLRVFVQLEGDCEGVFVSNKTQNGFDVTELKSGSSNTSFSYTLVANRADEVKPDGTISRYSDERFPKALGPQVTRVLETTEENKLVRTFTEEKQAELPLMKMSKSVTKLKRQK